MTTRRRLMMAAGGLLATPVAAQPDAGFTDGLGRPLTVARPARRVVLAEANDLLLMGLVHPDPVSLLVGWGGVSRFDQPMLKIWKRHYPRLADLPVIGGDTPDSFSLERVLALAPDLVVLPRMFHPTSDAVRGLEAAGIAVAFVSSPFPQGRAWDMAPVVTAMGRLLGGEERAARYAAFYSQAITRIANRVAAAPPGPRVLVEAHAGRVPCCATPGRQGSMGDFVSLAGGENIATAVVAAPIGQIGLEYILSRLPEVYIGTGGAYMASHHGLVLGPGETAVAARSSLLSVLRRPGIDSVPAVRAGRAHGLWHQLVSSPVSVVAAEAIARWVRPELFPDIDPAETLATLNARFLPVPIEGTLWVSVQDQTR